MALVVQYWYNIGSHTGQQMMVLLVVLDMYYFGHYMALVVQYIGTILVHHW
jgi:hypothetical protein